MRPDSPIYGDVQKLTREYKERHIQELEVFRLRAEKAEAELHAANIKIGIQTKVIEAQREEIARLKQELAAAERAIAVRDRAMVLLSSAVKDYCGCCFADSYCCEINAPTADCTQARIAAAMKAAEEEMG